MFFLQCSIERGRQRVGGREALAQRHERLGLDQPVLVRVRPSRAFVHRLVRPQRVLDLDRRDPDAARLEHVVHAARVVIEAVRVLT